MFQKTAALVGMIQQVVIDSLVFFLILLLSVIAFSNAWYILDNSEENRISGDSFWDSFIYSYTLSLGEFNFDDYNDSAYNWVFWSIFMATTILIQIVILNLLIAIQGDTFDRVMETLD